MIFPDGSVYEGQWRYDFANGIGRLAYINGNVYMGQWTKNRAHGSGALYK